jgi:hypothetical protein
MTNLLVREPAVSGSFYPAEPVSLRWFINEFLVQAITPTGILATEPGPLRGLIAPHAGYKYSGPIAAYAFKALRASRGTRRVFLLGPAHFVPIPGVALSSFAGFATPLGVVAVDVAIVQAMLAEQPRLYLEGNVAHVPEHSLEVELPFLQRCLPDVPIVPMLFGEVDVAAVARDLAQRLTAEDLLLVSSDLSHYHDYDTARTLDGRFLQDVLAGDLAAAARGEACGKAPILTLMHVAQQLGWTAALRDARNSGDTAGDRRRVVGYASVTYHAAPPHR